MTLSAAFYDSGNQFRAAVRVDVSLQDADIDQCSSEGWFSGIHRCNRTSMECVPLRGHGFVLDKFKCQCRKGFYHPNRVAANAFSNVGGGLLPVEEGGGRASPSGGGGGAGLSQWRGGGSGACLPCPAGCSFCRDDSPCAAAAGALRLALISVQSLSGLLAFSCMLLVYHYRRNKSIRASGLVLLEAILCGALLLYFPVGILYFQPSVFRCILLRWVRLLGFATVYGTLTLKLYRVLKVFLSRTAQRIPYMTSWRVLRLLAIILLVVCWFLVAWTSAVCQNPDRKQALIDVGYTPDGLQFSLCLLDRWDYMMAVAEFLFLLWAVYLCYAVRTVPSAFHEPRYMAIAVHNELVLSAIFHTIRFTLAPELHPDWMLLLFFAHTHLTVTVALGLLLIPKFLFAGTHMRDDIASEAYEDELDMGRSGSYLNSSITSAWSEHSLDPEDIRTPEETGPLSSVNGVRSCDRIWEKRTNEELKKLYSQLEVYKRKKMLANNPHLQKKRSSKKGLGRSLMRRITEIPESVHRQYSREDKEGAGGEHAGNRNSICMTRKPPLEPSHQPKPAREETLRSKVFSLKKSHSSYDHVRDQAEESQAPEGGPEAEGSLLDALMGKKLVKKKSDENVGVPGESAESVPLVCKSASAHNLTADKKPLHPRASMLQKSLSVIASAKEKTLGLTGKVQSAEEGGGRRGEKGEKGAKANSNNNNEENQNQAEEIQARTAQKGRGGKQQPATCPDPAKTKDLYDLSEVCPWEVEDLPTPSENKVQKHVSIAPEETTTIHGGGSKGGKSQRQKASDQSGARHPKEAQRSSAARAEVCPWEEACPGGPGEGSKAKAKGSQAGGEGSRVPGPDVCPWDFQEPQRPGDPDKAEQKKSRSQEAPRGGAEAGPREPNPREPNPRDPNPREPNPREPNPREPNPREPNPREPAQASKNKESPSRKKGLLPTRTAEREKPKDSRAKEKTPEEEVAPPVEKRRSAPVGAARARQAEVCPWDFEDASESGGSQSDPKAAPKAEVCPWDFEDSSSGKKA
ncbi:metabotropic glycine receptor-like [Menidia menidia]